MKCPVCSAEMSVKDFGGVIVDVCDHGCKGMWFDWLELSKLDEENEGLGDALRQALNSPRSNDENRPPIKCPKCGINMKSHRHRTAGAVNIDECYACGGMFLDSGELREIRESAMTEAEHEEYVNQLFSAFPELEKEKQNMEAMKIRAEGIRQATRIIRPSYYLKGK